MMKIMRVVFGLMGLWCGFYQLSDVRAGVFELMV